MGWAVDEAGWAAEVMANHRNRDMSVDTGMVVVIFISMMVFILLFYVKNEWCDLLFNNMTVSKKIILFLYQNISCLK